jgi:hypothetical protein
MNEPTETPETAEPIEPRPNRSTNRERIVRFLQKMFELMSEGELESAVGDFMAVVCRGESERFEDAVMKLELLLNERSATLDFIQDQFPIARADFEPWSENARNCCSFLRIGDPVQGESV